MMTNPIEAIGSDRSRQDPIAPIAPHDRLRQGATGSDWAVSGPRKALRSRADRDRYVADLLEEAVDLSVGEDVEANEDRVHELLVEAAGCRS